METNYLKIRWLGHSGFRISFNDPQTSSERVIHIDTWLQNPKFPEDLKCKTVDDTDLMLVTHGHFDHSSSAPEIVKSSTKENARIVSNFEICTHYQNRCGVPEGQLEKMNKGGTIDFGYCKVSMTPADHSSCCISHEGHIE